MEKLNIKIRKNETNSKLSNNDTIKKGNHQTRKLSNKETIKQGNFKGKNYQTSKPSN